jgi:hypothetical protein
MSTAIPTTNPNILCINEPEPWIAFKMTPQAKPTAINQFGIFLIHKSKNAERPLTRIINVSESANLFKTLLLTAEGYTAGKILSIKFVDRGE